MSIPVKVLAGLLILVALTGCYPVIRNAGGSETIRLTGSGNPVTQVMAFEDFDEIEASYTFKLDIRQGQNFEVVIRADDNLVDYLDVHQEGRTLRVRLNPEYNYDLRNADLEAEITMPDLIELEMSGASTADISGFEMGRDFTLRLSGASALTGDLVADKARFELSGASSVMLGGSARSLDLDASGSSRVTLGGFLVEEVDVVASGASVVTIFSNKRLDVDASGGSQVFYEGDPVEVFTAASGGASINSR